MHGSISVTTNKRSRISSEHLVKMNCARMIVHLNKNHIILLISLCSSVKL